MNTRSTNAGKHPGLVDVSPPVTRTRASGRPTKSKATVEQRATKAAKLVGTVGKLAVMEKAMAEDDACNDTPRAATSTKTSSKLRRTESRLDVMRTSGGSDIETNAGEDSQVEATTAEEHVSGADEESDEEDEEPPKKKAKRTKTLVRDSIKAYGVNERKKETVGASNGFGGSDVEMTDATLTVSRYINHHDGFDADQCECSGYRC